MKTKIYVCSNSGIEYITHPASISTIPVIVNFHDTEAYKDSIEITSDAFYNRLRFDKDSKPSISFAKYTTFVSFIETAINQKYEQIVFMLSARLYGDVYVSLNIARTQFPDFPIHVYFSDLICYPLAHMALEADKMFKNDATFDEVKKELDLYKASTLYFYSPSSDIEYNLSLDADEVILPKKGKVIRFNNPENIVVEKNPKDPLQAMISHITWIEDGIPFIMYTSRDSLFLDKLEERISVDFSYINKIKRYSIPPAVGMHIGRFAFGFGFVTKKSQE